MLASLTIKNVVLIDQLSIDFHTGLCALTGETGAGKSILLDSLGLALGARSDVGLVRKGADEACVIVSFDLLEGHPALSFLREQGLGSDTTIILRRIVSKDGRSKAFINDQPVSAILLKQVGEMLVEIHGQFDTQNLLNSKYHGSLLDEYADHGNYIEALKKLWYFWKENTKKLIDARVSMDKARSDEEYYRESLEDLDALAPKEAEENSLSNLRERLLGRDKILENLTVAETGIQEIEAASGSVWRSLENIGSEAKEAIDAMDRVNAEIQEVLASLQSLSSDIENSEYSLEEIDDRLFSLKAQARKHGCSIDDLKSKREEIAKALNLIENQDSDLEELMRQVDISKEKYCKKAKQLSSSRKNKAKKLSMLVMQELPPLKLEKARFEASIEELSEDQWNENGIDKIEFLVATNPNMEAGQLSKVASGGEMARFMLALKVVLSEVGSACALIFDEVDSGVGGATAAAVGERLERLSEGRQVLVVTHSPQVAAVASCHWIVQKLGVEKVTTNITPLLKNSQRREEIARMLAGAEVTDEARAAAGKLLEVSAA